MFGVRALPYVPFPGLFADPQQRAEACRGSRRARVMRQLPIGATRIGCTAVELPDGLAARHDPRQIGDVPLDQPAPLADVDLELADAPLAEAPLLRDGQRLGTAVRAVEDLGDVQGVPPAAPGAGD